MLYFLQGDTVESVAKELKSIVETGIYTFHLNGMDEMGVNRDYMLLEYQPASTLFLAEPSFRSSTSQLGVKNPQENGVKLQVLSAEMPEQSELKHSQKETWNLEQIGDFVRKLGFLDENKVEEGRIKIKHFLLLNQVSYYIIVILSSIHLCGLLDCSQAVWSLSETEGTRPP